MSHCSSKRNVRGPSTPAHLPGPEHWVSSFGFLLIRNPACWLRHQTRPWLSYLPPQDSHLNPRKRPQLYWSISQLLVLLLRMFSAVLRQQFRFPNFPKGLPLQCLCEGSFCRKSECFLSSGRNRIFPGNHQSQPGKTHQIRANRLLGWRDEVSRMASVGQAATPLGKRLHLPDCAEKVSSRHSPEFLHWTGLARQLSLAEKLQIVHLRTVQSLLW